MQKNIKIPLKEIAERISGELIGDGETLISGICPLDEARSDAISFSKGTRIPTDVIPTLGAILLSSEIDQSRLPSNSNIILVKDPYASLVSLIPLFIEEYSPAPSISQKADIAPTAKLGRDIFIGAFSVIGEHVQIGDNVTIHPHVTIYPHVVIGPHSKIHAGAVIREGSILGAHTIVQSGAVIGGDGFGYVPDPLIGLRAVPQVGHVVLADRVEVGANSCIDRATLGTTRIGTSSKIDNLVQVGHNTKIGNASIMCGQVGIAGSVTIGNGVILGGAVGVADHIEIVDGVRITARAAVIENLLTKGDYGGIPAIPLATHRRNQVALRRLGDFVKQMRTKPENKE